MTEELNIIVEELLLNSLETGCSIAVSYYHSCIENDILSLREYIYTAGKYICKSILWSLDMILLTGIKLKICLAQERREVWNS